MSAIEAAVIFGAAGFCAGFITMMMVALYDRRGGHEVQKEAVKRGFGTWVADEDGQTEFQWKGDGDGLLQ